MGKEKFILIGRDIFILGEKDNIMRMFSLVGLGNIWKKILYLIKRR